MPRIIASAETWEKVYSALQNVNFAAFDYNTVKQSILDYVKLYFPETFNDFIESSEFIAIVETFAYVAEIMAYRYDLNANENFMSTAQRKDSILRLAKYISYTASRPLPARGLVKITSISTTEGVVDSSGNNLANQVIRWNDTSNANWKDQFTIVMNRVLTQEFGTVSPTDRFQIQGILFELYSINNVSTATGVFSYTTATSGQSAPMELVPIAHDTTLGIIERRPSNNSNFSIVYGQDGLGDSSDTTGFFCYTKQGRLQKVVTTFDGVTPNQAYTVAISNINDVDIWVNNVDPVTGATLNTPSTLPYQPAATSAISGEWVQVDVASAQNVIFNTNPIRTKYEVETLANNQVQLLFGDGEFSNIPSGTFNIWVRSSLDQDIVIPQAAVVNTQSSFSYVDTLGNTQTFTFTYSLISALQNASASEDIEHVRTVAPSIYYSQDRMVNGQDYNSFMLQDSSILKLRSVNRTFAGDSNYIKWHDPSGTYVDVKVFSDDGMIYIEDINSSLTTPVIDIGTLISSYIEPLLSSTDLLLHILAAGVPIALFNNVFSSAEDQRIQTALTPPAPSLTVDMYYNTVTYQWYVINHSSDPASTFILGYTGFLTDTPLAAGQTWADGAFITTPLITITQPSLQTSYVVTRLARRIIVQSPTTSFWNTNTAAQLVDYSTLNSDYDEIDILQANLNCSRNGVLSNTWLFNVLGQEVVESGPNMGLLDVSRISVLPVDINHTGVPPGLDINNPGPPAPEGLAEIINPKYIQTVSGSSTLTLPIYYISGQGDVTVTNVNGSPLSGGASFVESLPPGTVSNTINFTDGAPPTTSVLIIINEYVYFTRLSINDAWLPALTTTENINSYVIDQLASAGLWKRLPGRSSLNFMWRHITPNYGLVDPAASNIIDSFIITKGYYLALKQWLTDPLAVQPVAPTSLDLRTSYAYLLDNKMISDTLILHPGTIKLLFGSKADPTLQANFVVIQSAQSQLTTNQIKTAIVTVIQNFFDISLWEFGETFYATELFAAIHTALPVDISSVAIVPVMPQNLFGNLFEIIAGEDEVFYPDISVDNIQLVTSYNTTNLNI